MATYIVIAEREDDAVLLDPFEAGFKGHIALKPLKKGVWLAETVGNEPIPIAGIFAPGVGKAFCAKIDPESVINFGFSQGT